MSSEESTQPFSEEPEILARLSRELAERRSPESPSEETVPFGDVLEETLLDFGQHPNTEFREGTLRSILPELSLLMILLNENPCGKDVIHGFEEVFDYSVSPGTVYPVLNEMEDSGMVSKHALVRTKVYESEADAEVAAQIDAAAEQLIALGVAMQRSLDILGMPTETLPTEPQ